MAAQIFPYGTALTVVWHLSKPDGTDFDITGYTYRVYYRTGNKETEASGSHVTASGNTISIVIPATEPSAPGEYALRLVLYQNNRLFCTLNYNAAFVLSRRLAQDLAMETQQEEVQVVHLYTVAEYYLFTPIIPTVGTDGYWYVNGTKVTDGQGEFVPSSHTMEYDAQTNYIIIDRDRVDSQGQSIAQTITSLADALSTAAQDHETAQEDHSIAAGDHQTAAADHSTATWDHQAIVDMIDLYEPITINGDVTNAPDEEDITSDENDLLKFKDRGVIYGMGYCILRRNKTFAEQVTKTNTIYEIRYDFDLDGESVTIPENCELRFNGGKVSNGTISCDNSKISGTPGLDCTVEGTLGETLDLGLLGLVCDRVTDNTERIVTYLETIQNYRGSLSIPANCKYDIDSVLNAIPLGCVMEIPSLIGFHQGNYRTKYSMVLSKDHPQDDTVRVIASAHHPAVTLLNTGTADYSGVTGDNKSGVLRRCSLLFADGFKELPGGTGKGPNHIFMVQGTKTGLEDTDEYTIQFRPLYSYENQENIDTCVFGMSANGYVGVNSMPTSGRELLIRPSHYSDGDYVGLRVDNNATTEASDKKAIVELRTKTADSNIVASFLLHGSTKKAELRSGSSPVFTFDGTSYSLSGFNGLTPATISGETPTLTKNVVYFVKNNSATTMTNLSLPDGAPSAMIVELIFQNTNTTVKHGSGIVLNDGKDWNAGQYDRLTLLRTTSISSNWIEIGRKRSYSSSGATRPLNPITGDSFFDTSLTPARPIWWSGTAWVDATGTAVE